MYFHKLELYNVFLPKRDAWKGFPSNFVGFPETTSAKNSPVTGPNLNPLPVWKCKVVSLRNIILDVG